MKISWWCSTSWVEWWTTTDEDSGKSAPELGWHLSCLMKNKKANEPKKECLVWEFSEVQRGHGEGFRGDWQLQQLCSEVTQHKSSTLCLFLYLSLWNGNKREQRIVSMEPQDKTVFVKLTLLTSDTMESCHLPRPSAPAAWEVRLAQNMRTQRCSDCESSLRDALQAHLEYRSGGKGRG